MPVTARFIAAIASLVGAVALALVAGRNAVHSGRSILPTDIPVLRLLAAHRTVLLTRTAEVISIVASPVGLIVSLTAVVIVSRRFGGESRLTALAAVTLIGVDLIDEAVKLVVSRPRPPVAFTVPGASALGSSFPSGHTIQSAAAYGVCAVILGRTFLRVRRILLAVVSVVMVITVGAARLYLGLHWFSDVIAGAIIGGCWLAVVLTGDAVLRRRRKVAQVSMP